MIIIQLWAVLATVAVFGLLILSRLPKPSRANSNYVFEPGGLSVTFRVDTVIEQDFKVAFVDDWNVGRTFSVHGPVVKQGQWTEDAEAKEPPFGKRAGVEIWPSPNWFQTSRLGHTRVFESGGCECGIALPYQIARHALEDIRQNPGILVSLQFKRKVERDGKVTYPIYGFEFHKPLD